ATEAGDGHRRDTGDRLHLAVDVAQVEWLGKVDVLECQEILHSRFGSLAYRIGAIAFVVDQLNADVDWDAGGVEDLDKGPRHPLVFEVRDEPPPQLLRYRAEGVAGGRDVQFNDVPVGRTATCFGYAAGLLCEHDIVVQGDSTLPGPKGERAEA